MNKQKKDPPKQEKAAEAPKPPRVFGHRYDVIRGVFVALTEDGPIPEVLRSPPASRIDC